MWKYEPFWAVLLTINNALFVLHFLAARLAEEGGYKFLKVLPG